MFLHPVIDPLRGQPKAEEKIFNRKSSIAAAFIATGGMGASAPINVVIPDEEHLLRLTDYHTLQRCPLRRGQSIRCRSHRKCQKFFEQIC